MTKRKTEIVIHSLKSTPLKFPSASKNVSKDFANKSRALVQKNGVETEQGKTALNVNSLSHMLCTDTVGAKKFHNRLADKEKFKVGKERYVRTSAIKHEIDERIEKPFDAQKIENLKENEKCLTALRDNSDSKTKRSLLESKIRREQKGLKAQKIKRDGISKCQMSGKPLEDSAHAHHAVRKADDPDLALDLDNIKIVNKEPHIAHHQNEKDESFK